MRSTFSTIFLLLVVISVVMSLGVPNPLSFQPSSNGFLLASSSDSFALPILLDSSDPEAVHIAAKAFAGDLAKVTGVEPEVHMDSLPGAIKQAIIVCTAASKLASSLRWGRKANAQQGAQVPLSSSEASPDLRAQVEGKWEAYEGAVISEPMEGVEEALVLIGSDRRGAVYALYTLSELMGVSPFYWWADVPIRQQPAISFDRNARFGHGEPTVKYRGFFLNDEHPVLWNWARSQFKIPTGPPFVTGMYEKVFELCLRLRGNYMWPAMWNSKFAVDGLDDLPHPPEPGPNQQLADRYGIVMGTSHHEPMSRNQKEFHDHGHGDWNFDTNKEFLTEFWKYGAERAKGIETLFTVGMRGDGDLALPGADIVRLEGITAAQQDILKTAYSKADLSDVPQMWAMYKEIMGYFATGLKVPQDVTPLLSDDNWGNLMAIMPEGKGHKAGGGIYYHADYVGDPRDYKWLNTVSLAKMWEQLNLAQTFDTKNIWILNVGDLKMLELPLEWFMNLAYDFDRWDARSLSGYLVNWAKREFAAKDETSEEIAEIMIKYTMCASRRKAELVDSDTFSLVNFEEAEQVNEQWSTLETRVDEIRGKLDKPTQLAFEQLVRTPIRLQANLNHLYLSAARSNLHATQSRTGANVAAKDALERFDKDYEISKEFHELNGGKWNFTLCQSHIGYQYWQAPMRNSMPPISFVSKYDHSYITGVTPAGELHNRITVENSLGAWPGDNRHNCPLGYACPDPTLLPIDPWGYLRYVEVCSGGTKDTNFTAVAQESWVTLSKKEGQVKGDGTADLRVYIGVDWSNFPDVKQGTVTRHDAHVKFSYSDTYSTMITVPCIFPVQPPRDFKGAVAGDGYAVFEAANFQRSTRASSPSASWVEIPHYGRTLSGMTILPPTLHQWENDGPSLEYDFWIGNFDIPSSEVEVTLHIGPTLNYILGKRVTISVQMDDGDVQEIMPIPEAPLGTLPPDWEEVTANECREVKVTTKLQGEAIGKHTLKVSGILGGIVLERVMVDLGGIKARGYSYLGPPESVILHGEEESDAN